MSKRISFKGRLSSVLFWSLVSAAFIGPGTVTTAAKAGANYGLTLIWALLFSTLATIVLQEAAARITIASDKSLGRILSLKYQGEKSKYIKLLVFFAVAFGCAAYQTGNLLGAVAGMQLLVDWNPEWIALGVAFVCGIILWIGSLKWMARILGMIVALMGIFFVYTAFQTETSAYQILEASFLPSVPADATLLIISLIGTTIVPYNLFLASGISKGQDISEMRWGISIAILLGGLISIAILVVGTQIVGSFSFEALSDALTEKMGNWSASFFAFGLSAAGLSSAITAPLATAVTAQSLFQQENRNWHTSSFAFRAVSFSILFIGLIFSLLDIQPIPAIILAQAINGILLPIVAIFLLLVVNDHQLLPSRYINSVLSNISMLLIVGITCFLGTYNILKALTRAFALDWNTNVMLSISSTISLLIVVVLVGRVFRLGNRTGS
ncbi:MAG: Nramp family divalent metal transporter [Bacteroidota bacterium]